MVDGCGAVRSLAIDDHGLVACPRAGRIVIEVCLACPCLVGASRDEDGGLVDLACSFRRGTDAPR